MEDERKEQEGLTADELIAVLTGKCVHEVQLGHIMVLLGLAAANAGGRLQLKLDGLKALDGKCIGIAVDEAAGTATVELLDAPRTEGERKIEPTHPASTMRH
jgi:hypothetical protein